MKYVIIQTIYRPYESSPEVMYICRMWKMWNTTDRLSKAKVWTNWADAAEVIELNNATDYKVIPITKKQLFIARLEGI